MSKTIALVGNQNCGKTTLFNALTGTFQHVGNFPGVTVEKKSGYIKKHKNIYELIDLPGIYSLSAYTSEESVSIQYLLEEKPHLIINIIDATHIERNLYLTMQLIELNIPLILVLNMMDEVVLKGIQIDIDRLQKHLGINVIPISASRHEGIEDVINAIEKVIGKPARYYDFSFGPVHEAMCSISPIIEHTVRQHHLPMRYCMTQLIENDKKTLKRLQISQNEYLRIEQIIEIMERKCGTDREAALIDMRYSFIEKLYRDCVSVSQNNELSLLEKLDIILTHKNVGIPIFILIMLFVFYMTFDVAGVPLQNMMNNIMSFANKKLWLLLDIYKIDTWLKRLICEGIVAGVGSVLSFLPVIVLLFFFLSLLEDSGYMARVAFVMDRALRQIGLSGKSIVPLLIGFGCSVPAIMSTRTLSSHRDRKMTMILIPFMSCSAKLPVYSMLISAFFPLKATIVMVTIYGISIFIAIIYAFILKRFLFVGEPVPFILELPPYRIPTIKNIFLNVCHKAKDFIHKAFTVIFIASIMIWLLQSFDISMHFVKDSSHSILALIGKWISPLLSPLGFSDWRISTALLTGMSAKESVVSTLIVLTSSSDIISINNALMTMLTRAGAFSFLVFSILYTPCIATFGTMKKELESLTQTVIIFLLQTTIAYFVTFIIYQMISIFM